MPNFKKELKKYESLARAEAIKNDIQLLYEALLAARNCTVEMVAGNAIFGDLKQQIKYLEKELKKIQGSEKLTDMA